MGGTGTERSEVESPVRVSLPLTPCHVDARNKFCGRFSVNAATVLPKRGDLIAALIQGILAVNEAMGKKESDLLFGHPLNLVNGNTACYGSQEKMVLLLHWSLGM